MFSVSDVHVNNIEGSMSKGQITVTHKIFAGKNFRGFAREDLFRGKNFRGWLSHEFRGFAL